MRRRITTFISLMGLITVFSFGNNGNQFPVSNECGRICNLVKMFHFEMVNDYGCNPLRLRVFVTKSVEEDSLVAISVVALISKYALIGIESSSIINCDSTAYTVISVDTDDNPFIECKRNSISLDSTELAKVFSIMPSGASGQYVFGVYWLHKGTVIKHRTYFEGEMPNEYNPFPETDMERFNQMFTKKFSSDTLIVPQK